MESLPSDLLTKVLEYALLPDRLNIARCNTTLMHIVTRECRSLWTTIDFSPFEHFVEEDPRREAMERKASEITDEMLAALLTRVNAVEVTKSLKLQGCKKIVGNGLEPLRGSRVLGRINLQVGPPRESGGVDEMAIMDILRTMFPYKLFDVVFQDWYWMPGNGHSYETQSGGTLLRLVQVFIETCILQSTTRPLKMELFAPAARIPSLIHQIRSFQVPTDCRPPNALGVTSTFVTTRLVLLP